MELELVKNASQLHLVSGNENLSIVIGAKSVPSERAPSDRSPAQHRLLPLTAANETLGDTELAELSGSIQDEIPGYR